MHSDTGSPAESRGKASKGKGGPHDQRVDDGLHFHLFFFLLYNPFKLH